MAIRVSSYPHSLVFPPSPSHTLRKRTKLGLKGTRLSIDKHYVKSPGLQQGLRVCCQSSNGKPTNKTVKGTNVPGFEAFPEAGIPPLGQSWDPWKRSSNVGVQEADSSTRDPPAEAAGREDYGSGSGPFDVRGKSSHKYGPVGNDGEEPYRLLADGRKAYLDELDILTLLEPPPFIRPMTSVNYNHAAFLWKKINDIPEERRHRLLDLLEPKHISAMWKQAALRYEAPELYLEDASRMLHNQAVGKLLHPLVWTGQVNEGILLQRRPRAIWKAYCRLDVHDDSDDDLLLLSESQGFDSTILLRGGPLLEGLGRILTPLYFRVKPMKIVPGTKEQCDFAFSYEDGHFELRDAVPEGYPQPGRHPWPFGNAFFDYIRVVGPGVVVGQLWYGCLPPKGKGPHKYLGEFVLIQNYDILPRS